MLLVAREKQYEVNERSHDDPRSGALDFVWVEDGGKEQKHHQTIDDVGEGIIEAIVGHEDDETEAYTRAYPHDLHTASG